MWSADSGVHAIHRKHYLPDEDGFREARWYQRGSAGFDVAQTEVGCVGVLLCTELMFTEHRAAVPRCPVG